MHGTMAGDGRYLCSMRHESFVSGCARSGHQSCSETRSRPLLQETKVVKCLSGVEAAELRCLLSVDRELTGRSHHDTLGVGGRRSVLL